jgi:GDP-4-dehydro-6-deoxy-D-mannose reductase
VGRARILITGVDGFVGRHLARWLRERGRVPLGLGTEAVPPDLGGLIDRHFVADLRDAERLTAVVADAKPDAIVHLAAQSSAARSFEFPVETFEVNAMGTWNLVEALRRSAPGARLLAVGTGEAYGPQPEGSRVAEDAPFRPVSPYALSKAAGDAIADCASRIHGLDVVRLRPFGHTGPGQANRFVVSSIAHQIAAIEAGQAEPVLRVGNLDVTRDLLDVREVVEAYESLLDRGRAGGAYNVCRGQGVQLAEVARSLVERARMPIRIEVDPARSRPTDVPYLVGDPTTTEREVGWKARLPLERTLDDVLEEWRAKVA